MYYRKHLLICAHFLSRVDWFISSTWVGRSCTWMEIARNWSTGNGTSLGRASFPYKHYVCLEAAYAFFLEDVGGRVVHWSGPVWSPQSSVLWGWHGQRCLPKLADSACFFYDLFLQIFPVPESIVQILACVGFHFANSWIDWRGLAYRL